MFSGLFLSFPLFYVIGLVCFIRWFISLFKSTPKPDRQTILKALIAELTASQSIYPDKKIPELIEEYKHELNKANSSAVALSSTAQKTDLLHQDVSTLASNWYTDNSINLLLYIGAFLIVASASIFVGFQWETISGIDKAMIISVLTGLWFIFGIWFYGIPKVRSAGLTFIGIGALLIPFSGFAWHNFVLINLGVSLGTSWCVTSIIGALVYISLIWVVKKPFFAYLFNFSCLSLVFSLIELNHLVTNYYILGSIFTALVMLGVRMFIDQNWADETLYSQPLEYSANLLLPIALGFGLITLLSQSLNLFSFENTSALFLASFYYALYFFYTKKSVYLALSESLIIITLIFFFNWQDLATQTKFYGLELTSLALFFGAFILKKLHTKESSEITVTLALISSVFWYVFAQFLNVAISDVVIFAAMVTGLSFLTAIYLEHSRTRILGILFVYILLNHILQLVDIDSMYLPIAFTTLSYVFYSISFLFDANEQKVANIYKNSVYIALILTPLIFGFTSRLSYSSKFYEIYALLSGYGSLALFAFESYYHNNEKLRYFTSAIAMYMYEWQIFYWKFSEQQFYSLPLALYLLVLAFLRYRKGDESTRKLLDLAATLCLIFPTLGQAWEVNGAIYALILGAEGAVLVLLGNSLAYKVYTFAGTAAIILAVVSQTYNYILSLPRWIITGIGGLAFLILAVYLLVYRKDQNPNS